LDKVQKRYATSTSFSYDASLINWHNALRHVTCVWRNVRMRQIYCNSFFLFSYPACDNSLTPGLAADMRFLSNVIAFIGPACGFALDPVATLAAYWNIPIVTGLGDQVNTVAYSLSLPKYNPMFRG
jgi:hypothetical protein